MRRALRAVLFVLVALLVVSCAPARKKVQGDIVRSVRFTGNGAFFSGHNDYQLKGAMEQSDSSFGVATIGLNYIAKPVVLNRAALDRDGYRLETWYAQQGWFDARFKGWEIHHIRRQSFRRAGMVRIVGQVAPGEASEVRNVEVTGMRGAAERVFASTIKRTGSVQSGDQFALSNVDITKAEFLRLLANNGYPYATITDRIDAFPEDHAVDVTFEVQAGRTAKFGEIQVEGAEDVDPRVVLETLPFEPGDTYDAEKLRRGQQRLFALGTYSIVNIETDLSDPEQADVPVTVKVTETRFQTLRLGGGADYNGSLIRPSEANGSLLTPRLSMQYRHVHLFDRLLHAELGGSIGYIFDITGNQPPDTPYSYKVDLSVSTPRLAGPRWGLSAGMTITQATLAGQYAYFNPKTSARITHRFNDAVSVDFGPTLQIDKILGANNGGLTARSLFGAEFDGSYRLVTLDMGFTADWRDDPLNTTRGTYYRASVRQALPFVSASNVQNSYVFTELTGEARTYRRIHTGKRQPFTLALRGRARAQFSETKDAEGNAVGIPYPERLFQGGSADLRGFRINHVGPSETVCTYADARTPGRVANPFSNTPNADKELARRYLPVGGEAGLLGSAEARFALPYGLSFVPFMDAGMLSPSIPEISPTQIRAAAGVGIRYNSIVGPIRFDLAFRPVYPEDTTASAVFGCEDGDAVPRGADLLSSWFGQGGPDRTIPFAINFIITIGQAF